MENSPDNKVIAVMGFGFAGRFIEKI